MAMHCPVLVSEVVRLLAFEGEGWLVDGCLGAGGHARAFLEASPEAKLLGIDIDPETVEITRDSMAPFGSRAVIIHGDYADMAMIMKEHSIAAARSILLDLGWSGIHLALPERGFSFTTPGPLDMRYDRSASIPLGQWLKHADVEELTQVIRKYGEERWAKPIARNIKRRLEEGRLEDTRQLAEAVTVAIPPKYRPRRIHPATRTFQALRIELNGELRRLERFLERGWELLDVGGRMGLISFHSLEDRMVKRRLAQLAASCNCPPELPVCRCGVTPHMRLLTRGAIKPDEPEIRSNKRARSARLRVAQRIA